MPADSDLTRRLRDLHDDYAWEVNAAIADGRDDLVWRLVDDYTDQALMMMTDGLDDACARPGCTMCARPRPTGSGPVSRRRRWWRSVTGRKAGERQASGS
jgi:hypothetical protein